MCINSRFLQFHLWCLGHSDREIIQVYFSVGEFPVEVVEIVKNEDLSDELRAETKKNVLVMRERKRRDRYQEGVDQYEKIGMLLYNHPSGEMDIVVDDRFYSDYDIDIRTVMSPPDGTYGPIIRSEIDFYVADYFYTELEDNWRNKA